MKHRHFDFQKILLLSVRESGNTCCFIIQPAYLFVGVADCFTGGSTEAPPHWHKNFLWEGVKQRLFSSSADSKLGLPCTTKADTSIGATWELKSCAHCAEEQRCSKGQWSGKDGATTSSLCLIKIEGQIWLWWLMEPWQRQLQLFKTYWNAFRGFSSLFVLKYSVFASSK